MSIAYLVFQTYGVSHRVVFLAACSSEESAKKFCLENKLLSENQEFYTTRAAGLLYSAGKVVIEKVALI